MGECQTVDLSSYASFEAHPWVRALKARYRQDAVLAIHATNRMYQDLLAMNEEHIKEKGHVLFSKAEFRVKTPRSSFKKLWRIAVKEGPQRGITQGTLAEMYEEIRDLAGVRFACPYFDEVKITINGLIRPKLQALGYATDLSADPRLADEDWLDLGDEAGYRAYHFYVRVPTPTDIFGNAQLVLCEVQGRSELQHMWAVKSHDLLYNKEADEWDIELEREDMKQLSNALRAADQFLQSIRDRVAEKGRGGAL